MALRILLSVVADRHRRARCLWYRVAAGRLFPFLSLLGWEEREVGLVFLVEEGVRRMSCIRIMLNLSSSSSSIIRSSSSSMGMGTSTSRGGAV